MRNIWNRILKFCGFKVKRKLEFTYTTELANDLKIIHGLNVEEELTKMLTQEILSNKVDFKSEYVHIQINEKL